MSPRTLLHATSLTEAVTWAGLIIAMIAKYVLALPAGSVLVSIAGAAHGTVAVAYLFSVVTMAAFARWRNGMIVVAGVCSIIPFATLWFDAFERRTAPAAASGTPASPAHEVARGRVNRGVLRLTSGLPGWVGAHPLTLGAAAVALFVVVATQSLTR